MRESSCEQLVGLLHRSTTRFISPSALGTDSPPWGSMGYSSCVCPVVIIHSHSFTLNSVLVEMINYMVTLLTNSDMPSNLLPTVQTWFLLKWQLGVMVPGRLHPVLSRDLCSHLGTYVHLKAKSKYHQPVSGIQRLCFPKWGRESCFSASEDRLHFLFPKPHLPEPQLSAWE